MDVTGIRYGPELSVNPETLEFLEADGKLEEWKVQQGILDMWKEDTYRFQLTNSDEIMEITIRELSAYAAGHGSVVWHAAFILGQYILINRELFAGKRCLEMGAGCGLTGICAGKICSEVVMTDFKEELLENMNVNIEKNRAVLGGPDCTVRVGFLDWKDPEAFGENEEFDIILGADVVYAPGLSAPLAHAVKKFLRPGGTFYGVSLGSRPSFLTFIHTASQIGLQFSTEDLTEFCQRYCAFQGTSQESDFFQDLQNSKKEFVMFKFYYPI